MKRFLLSILLIALVGLYQSNAQVLISKVEPTKELVTITNYGATAVTLTAGWQFCSLFGYAPLGLATVVDGASNLPTMSPGTSVTFDLTTTLPLNDAAADLGLYNSNSFASPSAMLHFVQWGAGGLGRESVAVSKGIWNAGDFLSNTTNNTDPIYSYNGATTPLGESDWESLVRVTFQVDLSNQTLDPAGVHIAGTFQGFDPGSTPMTDLGNSCYEYTLCIAPGDTVQYKFLNGNTFNPDKSESVPPQCGSTFGGCCINRFIFVPNNDTILPKVCYGQCLPCSVPLVPLTLYVDMSKETPIADTVSVIGPFNNFTPGATVMAPIGNGVYCATVQVQEGSLINYKFVNGTTFAGAENINTGDCAANNGFGDRSYLVPTGVSADTVETVCFNSCLTCSEVNLVEVAMYVNTCLLDSVSPFGIFVGGSFNNFDAGQNPMADSGNGIWCVTIEVNANDTIYYKFNNGGSIGGFFESGDSLCGVSDGFGGFNRVLITDTSDIVLDTVCYSQCDDCVKPIGCPAPSNVQTINIGFFKATLTWDVVPNSLGYELRGGLQGSNPNSYVEFTLNGSANNSLLATSLTKNTSYEYQVRAACLDDQNNVIYSDWTSLSFFTTKNCTPPNPSSTTNITNNSAQLNWTPQANAIGYILRGQAIGSLLVTINVSGGGVGSFNATSLPSGTPFQWVVTTVCSLSPYIETLTSQSTVNMFTTLSASSKTMSERNVSVFPNPAEDVVYVSNLSGENTIVNIFDLSGKSLLEMNTSQVNEQIDISDIPAGVYQIIIQEADSWKSEKLVISK